MQTLYRFCGWLPHWHWLPHWKWPQTTVRWLGWTPLMHSETSHDIDVKLIHLCLENAWPVKVSPEMRAWYSLGNEAEPVCHHEPVQLFIHRDYGGKITQKQKVKMYSCEGWPDRFKINGIFFCMFIETKWHVYEKHPTPIHPTVRGVWQNTESTIRSHQYHQTSQRDHGKL